MDWQSQYTVGDNKGATQGPSMWKFTKENTFPHKDSIM